MQLQTLGALAVLCVSPALADTVFFSTGTPDGSMAAVSQPSSTGQLEIETGDDFVLTSDSVIRGATFTGLLPTGAPLSDIVGVRIEIYEVFPNLSDVGRTSGPPTFSTPEVPTRVNSPSDVELDDRSSFDGNLSFTPGIISPIFTAKNSVGPDGIQKNLGSGNRLISAISSASTLQHAPLTLEELRRKRSR